MCPVQLFKQDTLDIWIQLKGKNSIVLRRRLREFHEVWLIERTIMGGAWPKCLIGRGESNKKSFLTSNLNSIDCPWQYSEERKHLT